MLSVSAEKLIENIVPIAYKDKATYKEQYCPQLMIKKNISTKSHFYTSASINEPGSLFVVGPFNNGYLEGVAQTTLKLSDI